MIKKCKGKENIEEWEREFLSDNSELIEEVEIQAPDYSSGESEFDERLETNYQEMTKEQ